MLNCDATDASKVKLICRNWLVARGAVDYDMYKDFVSPHFGFYSKQSVYCFLDILLVLLLKLLL